MSSLDVIHKLRQRLHATAAAKPNQWHTGVAMLRFLALMLLLTLLVRGTAATTLPVVSVTAPYQGVVTQSFTVSGQISPGIGTPLTIPEGLLVEQIFVQPGDQVTEGQTLALLSLDDVRAEIEQVQASMQQHQVQANQLLAGQAADPFAWQQAQQQLDRAYADYQQAAAEGEADVSQAQNVLDAAHQVLAEVCGGNCTRQWRHQPVRCQYGTGMAAFWKYRHIGASAYAGPGYRGCPDLPGVRCLCIGNRADPLWC